MKMHRRISERISKEYFGKGAWIVSTCLYGDRPLYFCTGYFRMAMHSCIPCLIFKNLKEMKKLLNFISGYCIDHLRKECWSRT